MKKIWVHKSTSFKDAEEFDLNYYLALSSEERMDIMQYLREICWKLKGKKYARGKGLRGSIRVIQ